MRKLFTILFILTSLNCFAHQPKLIKYSPSIESPHKIFFPEISKAYYSKLTGKPHYYVITSDKEFLFYAGILSPKINENYKWLSLNVIDENNNIIYQAIGSNHQWQAWYEPYARDWYWKGPEIGGEKNQSTGFKRSFPLDAGKYLIKVYNDDNLGNYSLAVGEAEFFGSNTWEKIMTWTPILFYIGPYMDIVHWNKFDVRAYIPHIALIVLIFIFYFIIKKLFFRKKNKLDFIN